MKLRTFLAEAGTLAGLAIACALVSNAFAGKERKLTLPGDYPNATRVTARAEAPAPLAGEPAGSPPGGADGEPPAAAAAAPAKVAPPPAEAPPARPAVSPVAGAATAAAPPSGPAASASGPVSAAELLGRFPAHGQPYVEIGGEAAAWLHARGALFLDARRSKDYAGGHVAGARSFPVWESELLKDRVEALVGEGRNGSLPVVLYCSGGDCEDSHMLAQTLFGAGFENLLVYRDGFPDWAKRGGAVATGGVR